MIRSERRVHGQTLFAISNTTPTSVSTLIPTLGVLPPPMAIPTPMPISQPIDTWPLAPQTLPPYWNQPTTRVPPYPFPSLSPNKAILHHNKHPYPLLITDRIRMLMCICDFKIVCEYGQPFDH